jgi:hypothetical protein
MTDEDDKKRTIGEKTFHGLKDDIKEDAKEYRQDLKQIDRDSRDRDTELHKKVDKNAETFRTWGDNLKENLKDDLKAEDKRIDELVTKVTELSTLTSAQGKQIEALQKADPYDGAPWYARPEWIRNILLALAAGIAAVLMALGYSNKEAAEGTPKKSTTEEISNE